MSLVHHAITRLRLNLPIPACATTHDKRRNNMTPQMLSRHLTRTPSIHPNFTAPLPASS